MAKRTGTIRTGVERRYDAMMESRTGRGSSKDRTQGTSPLVRRFSPAEMRQWYEANGFIQNIVDGPAEDATREWITIKTNRDTDDSETGQKGLGISRMIQNRMTELGVREKLKELIRYSRMYNEGGILFYGVTAEQPQVDAELAKEIPDSVRSLDYLNVIGPDYFSMANVNNDPLSKIFHTPSFHIQSVNINPSRMSWMVHSYIPEERRGISVIETVLDAILAQDTSLWSVNHLVYMMGLWIFKSQKVEDLSPEKLAALLEKMNAVISTMSSVAIGIDEEIARVSNMDVNSNLKQLFDFIFENIAGLAKMPKSRIMGQSQGVITSGQYDIVNYHDTIAKFQELEVRPIIEKIISIIVHETEGAIYKALGGNISSLDWEFTFNKLWSVSPAEQAEIELKEAQADQIYITQGVLYPDEVRQRRLADLEEFPGGEEDSGLDFRTKSVVIAGGKMTDSANVDLGESEKKSDENAETQNA